MTEPTPEQIIAAADAAAIEAENVERTVTLPALRDLLASPEVVTFLDGLQALLPKTRAGSANRETVSNLITAVTASRNAIANRLPSAPPPVQ